MADAEAVRVAPLLATILRALTCTAVIASAMPLGLNITATPAVENIAR
jgi:hypothetical protein